MSGCSLRTKEGFTVLKIVHRLDTMSAYVEPEVPVRRHVDLPRNETPRWVTHESSLIPEAIIAVRAILRRVAGVDIVFGVERQHAACRMTGYVVTSGSCQAYVTCIGLRARQVLEIYPRDHREGASRFAARVASALGLEHGGKDMGKGSSSSATLAAVGNPVTAFSAWICDICDWLRVQHGVKSITPRQRQDIPTVRPKPPAFHMQNSCVRITFFGFTCLEVIDVFPVRVNAVGHLSTNLQQAWSSWGERDRMISTSFVDTNAGGDERATNGATRTTPIDVWLRSRHGVASVHLEGPEIDDDTGKPSFDVEAKRDSVIVSVRPGNGTVTRCVVRPIRREFDGACDASVMEHVREHLIDEYHRNGSVLGLPGRHPAAPADPLPDEKGDGDGSSVPALLHDEGSADAIAIKSEETRWYEAFMELGDGTTTFTVNGPTRVLREVMERITPDVTHSRSLAFYTKLKDRGVIELPDCHQGGPERMAVVHRKPYRIVETHIRTAAGAPGSHGPGIPTPGGNDSSAPGDGNAGLVAGTAGQSEPADSDAFVGGTEEAASPPSVAANVPDAGVPEGAVPACAEAQDQAVTATNTVLLHAQAIGEHVRALHELGCTSVDVMGGVIRITIPIDGVKESEA